MTKIARQWEYYSVHLVDIDHADDNLRAWTDDGWQVVNFSESVTNPFGFQVIAWLRRELP